MKRTLTRDFYIPSKHDKKITEPDLGIEIYYMKDGKGNPLAMGFGGKRSKPDFYNRFMSEDSRALHTKTWIEGQKESAANTAKRKAEANSFEHTLKVGDILYSSWGYDQTNIDYYQVTDVVGKKSVKIQEIGQLVEHRGQGCDNASAAVDSFKEGSKPMLKRVKEGNRIMIESYANAYPWDGKPKHQTAWGWGH